jgi:hypothetical protein
LVSAPPIPAVRTGKNHNEAKAAIWYLEGAAAEREVTLPAEPQGPTAQEPQPHQQPQPQAQPQSQSSAERTAADGWQDDAPTDLPPPSSELSIPSRQPGSEPAQDRGLPDDRAPGGPAGGPAASAEAGDQGRPGSRDDNLRMRVRSDRLTTDPSVDADLVSRLIDGVEGL